VLIDVVESRPGSVDVDRCADSNGIVASGDSPRMSTATNRESRTSAEALPDDSAITVLLRCAVENSDRTVRIQILNQ
jgi:hypothetical protein